LLFLGGNDFFSIFPKIAEFFLEIKYETEQTRFLRPV